MQGSLRRTVGACATAAVLFSSIAIAQIGPFPRWGLTRVDSWASGSQITVGDVELATTAIALTFAFDPTVGATISSVGHRSVRPDGTGARWDYPAAPPAGQPLGFWKGVLRPLDSNDPFEVTPDGRLVWEYINRFDEDRVIMMQEGTRYPEGYFEVDDWSCGAS